MPRQSSEAENKMTIREYTLSKLSPFGMNAQLVEVELIENGLNPDCDYNSDVAKQVGQTMCRIIEGLMFAPRLESVNESGFSMSWDTSKLGQYYLWLCKKWSMTPNSDILGSLGISMVIDRTNCW